MNLDKQTTKTFINITMVVLTLIALFLGSCEEVVSGSSSNASAESTIASISKATVPLLPTITVVSEVSKIEITWTVIDLTGVLKKDGTLAEASDIIVHVYYTTVDPGGDISKVFASNDKVSTDAVALKAEITNLTAGTTYYVAVQLENSTDTTKKVEKTEVDIIVVLAKKVTAYNSTAHSGTALAVLGQAIFDEILGEDDAVLSGEGYPNGNAQLNFGDLTNTAIVVAEGNFTVKKSALSTATVSANDKLTIEFFGETAPIEIAEYKPIEIHNWQDLQAIRQDLTGNYVLMKDIVFPDWNGNGKADDYNFFPLKGIIPDGEAVSGEGFKGIFDGGGHTISRLYIDRVDEEYIGLFGMIEPGARVSDVGILNNVVIGKDYVGGLAAWNLGEIIRCYVTGTVTGNQYVGGLVGELYRGKTNLYPLIKFKNDKDGSVSDSYATGDVKGIVLGNNVHSIGGLIGAIASQKDLLIPVKVQDCYATGSVMGVGSKRIGGLIGSTSGKRQLLYGNKFIINRCYAMGNVRGRVNVGGLVGYNAWSSIENSVYATGNVTGEENVGGLVGYNGDGHSSGKSSVSGYATGNVIGIDNSANRAIGRVGGLVGNNSGTAIGFAIGDVTTNINGVDAVGFLSGTGGLVGSNFGTAIGYATGKVTGPGISLGGLVGNNSGTVIGYATGKVTGPGVLLGGLVGENRGTAIGYAIGKVNRNGDGNVGGLIGRNRDGTVIGYWDIVTTNQPMSSGGTGISRIGNVRETDDLLVYGYYDDKNSDGQKDTDENEVFHQSEFRNAFQVSSLNNRWPQLKTGFKIGDLEIIFRYKQPPLPE